MIIPTGRLANNKSHPKPTKRTARFGVLFLFGRIFFEKNLILFFQNVFKVKAFIF
jgi:hypothetical protein